LFGSYRSAPPAGLLLDNLTAIALRFSTVQNADNVDETALPLTRTMPF
jgi:hypothetical protein